MTVTFSTDSNNDLFLGTDDNISVVGGIDAVLKACETASKAQLGEMILSGNSGIPNFQSVWIGSPNYALFISYLRNTLLSVDGVQEITNLEVTQQDNILQYTATIKTKYGTGSING